MTKLVDFKVARPHQGDRITDDGTEVHRFAVDEIRTANPATVKHLVDSGVLVAPDAEKAEAPVENKSEGNSPENKAEAGAEANKGKPKPKG